MHTPTVGAVTYGRRMGMKRTVILGPDSAHLTFQALEAADVYGLSADRVDDRGSGHVLFDVRGTDASLQKFTEFVVGLGATVTEPRL